MYTAAETNTRQFIELVFNSSAGKVVFNAYRYTSPLPEDVARAFGHEDTAQYLESISKRYRVYFHEILILNYHNGIENKPIMIMWLWGKGLSESKIPVEAEAKRDSSSGKQRGLNLHCPFRTVTKSTFNCMYLWNLDKWLLRRSLPFNENLPATTTSKSRNWRSCFNLMFDFNIFTLFQEHNSNFFYNCNSLGTTF